VTTRVLLATVVLAVSAVPAAAQTLSGAAEGFNVQRRIYYQGAVYQQTGLWYGAAGAVRLGPVQVGVSGLFGTLKGDGSTQNPDVTARTTAATLLIVAAPWLALGAQVEARRFEAAAGVTTWRLIGGHVRLEPGLGLAGLRGLADASVLPASSVTGGPSLKMAVQARVGATYAPPGSLLQLRVGYRFERYDIDAVGASPARYEQYRGIIAEAGIRLGR
jgi:hypothetical protein